MAKRTHNTPPPLSSEPSVNGGASEHARLDWVLRSQSDLAERISAIEAHAENSEKTLLRIEKLIEKVSDNQVMVLDKHCNNQEGVLQKHSIEQSKTLDNHCTAQSKVLDLHRETQDKALNNLNQELAKSNDKIVKINYKLIAAGTAVVVGCAVFMFIVNGEIGKISSFMEQQETKKLQPTKAPTTK